MDAGDPKLLPPNSRPLERVIDAAGEARLQALTVDIRHLWNPALCPISWLPVLAWTLGVENWRSDWPEETKRAVIAATPRIKRLKGTVAAVRSAVQAVAGAAPVGIIEWFKPGGSGLPLTAVVDIDVTAGAPSGLPYDAIKAANSAKRESVHLSVRLTVRPNISQRTAALIRRPIVCARLNLSGDMRPNISAPTLTAVLMRRPLVLARLHGNLS
ncbi:phage tail protein I [Brevundimonas sp.]|uniref:phage tail protein I n=1 Tax=Brevundimonas sp. TaxID=1871086 RepID=UPI000E904B6D|nr:phage tail protein I [Brevundimonas sp.]HBY42992.1 phage tail protein I [Brevundimonas sp.]